MPDKQQSAGVEVALHYFLGATLAAIVTGFGNGRGTALFLHLGERGSLLALVGFILLGGGVAGILRDKAWLPQTLFLDEPKPSPRIRWLMSCSIAIGFLLILAGAFLK